MIRDELRRLLDRLPQVALGVIGDFCLDAYWVLDESRGELSLETRRRTRAVRSQRYSPGGAGNVALNAVALGVAKVHAFGVIGPDPFGRHLRELLTDAGIDTSGIVLQERQWDTCAYGKPFAGPEEGERLDFGRFNVLSRHSADTLLAGLERVLDSLDGLIINQQIPRGVHSDDLIPRLQALLEHAARRPVLLDARDVCHRYTDVIFKLNAAEAARLCGRGPATKGGPALGHGQDREQGIGGGSPADFRSRTGTGSMQDQEQGIGEVSPGPGPDQGPGRAPGQKTNVHDPAGEETIPYRLGRASRRPGPLPDQAARGVPGSGRDRDDRGAPGRKANVREPAEVVQVSGQVARGLPGPGPGHAAGPGARGPGHPPECAGEVPDADLAELARRIHARSGRQVIITRGDRGMLAFDGARLCEVPGIPHHGPIDPVGAGDTAAAAITACLAAGASLAQAIEVGNYAAGVVVRKLRQTGTATPAEILAIAAG